MRRKLIPLFLTLCLVLGILPVGAQAASAVVVLKLESPWCAIDSQVALVDESNDQVAPYAVQVNGGGYTLLPIRRLLEAFGGTVEWVPATNGVLCTLNGHQVELAPGSAQAQVDGQTITMDVPAEAKNDRTFVPVRFVSENLGLNVAYEPQEQLVVVSAAAVAQDQLLSLESVQLLLSKVAEGQPQEETQQPQQPQSSAAVQHTSGSYSLPSGTVSANVITVDLSDPSVSVKSAIVGGKLNATAPFSDIVASSGGAVAVINGNFFESYEDIQDPIGPVMVGGQFIYGNSGSLTSVGITDDGRMYYGRPSIFYRVKTTDGGTAQEWSGYNFNVFEQAADASVIYTPARGTSVPVVCAGAVLTVRNGVTTGYQQVAVGDTITIPADGYALWMGTGFTSTHYYAVPEMGRTVALEPYLRVADEEGFSLEGVTTILSGAPRLVKDGAIETYLDPGFTEARFTTSITPRTAIGTTADGKLLMVQTSSASIQQMRELMLQLGCVDAVNLDGGASTGMYYTGQTLATPGRQLTTTLQVFVNG